MTIATGNIAALDQGVALLETLDDDLYRAPGSDGGSSIGAHVRHCIDFFERFLDGVDHGRIDYDARTRDARIATERQVALVTLRTLRVRLAQLATEDAGRPLEVRADAAAATAATVWCRSSVGRELQVLLSHTVHHYALIAVALRARGVFPSPDFGVAPSTLADGEAKARTAAPQPLAEACVR